MNVREAGTVGLHLESDTGVVASSVVGCTIEPSISSDDQFTCGISSIAVYSSKALKDFVCVAAVSCARELENRSKVVATSKKSGSVKSPVNPLDHPRDAIRSVV